jgi:protein involved in polysaccharide export with SLBB domain
VTVKTSTIRVNQGGPITESPSRTIVELQDGERVSELLSMIGGIDPWWDSDKTFLERDDATAGRAVIPVSPYQLVVMKDLNQNVELKNGDTLTIPLVENRVYVLGEVKSSGAYLYLADRRALDYVVQAGGGTQRANFSQAYVQKRNGETIPIAKDPVIYVGDTIVVPEIALKWWQDYVNLSGLFMGLTGFALLLLAL